jgi:hypothetical protein
MQPAEDPAHDHRLLSDLDTVTMECRDCGRVRQWGFDELRKLPSLGAQTFGDLRARVRCDECRNTKRSGRNVAWLPAWHKRIKALAG